MFLNFLYAVHVSVLHAFLVPNNIPLCRYATFCLSIYQLMGIWVVSSSWLPLPLWTASTSFCVDTCLISHDIYLRMGWLGHIVTLCLTFWRTRQLFSKGTTPFYITTNNALRLVKKDLGLLLVFYVLGIFVPLFLYYFFLLFKLYIF